MEIMKNIIGYENYYIGSYGNVYNKYYKEVKQRKATNGYMRFNVRKGNIKYEKPTTITTHRAVAEAFLPKIDGKPYINHKDGNKENNHVDNLEWVTASENSLHSFRNGLQVTKKGAESPNAKQVIQLDMNDNIIKVWGSITDAAKSLKIDNGDISKCCYSKKKHVGGCKWQHLGR